jgi:hypothetical protein
VPHDPQFDRDAPALVAEPLLSLHEAAALVPGRGRNRVHASTLGRWIGRGVRTRDGGRVRLRGERIGSRWFTTAAWLSEFRSTLTSDAVGQIGPPPRSPSAIASAAAAAGLRLEAMGG